MPGVRATAARAVEHRLVGAQEWKTLVVPAKRALVHRAGLGTVAWEWAPDSRDHAVQIEINQPDGLRSTVLYCFKCGYPPPGAVSGVAAGDIARTNGGPLAELVADAQLAPVRARSGAQVALVNRYDVRQTMTGGQLMKLPATPNPAGSQRSCRARPGGAVPWRVLGCRGRGALALRR